MARSRCVCGLSGELLQFPPRDLLWDRQLLAEEQRWLTVVMTAGSEVVVEGPVDNPIIVGVVITPATDPVSGAGVDRMCLVEHAGEGAVRRADGTFERGLVRRWYQASRLAPAKTKRGEVLAFSAARNW